MEIKKVHCFFEQSGTFKNEFKKLGIPAEDYDIQNEFGETDNVIDLFEQINLSYSGKKSVFDSICTNELIFAFFPCIYFSDQTMLTFSFQDHNLRCKNDLEKIDIALNRLEKRTKFHSLLYMLLKACLQRKIPLIIENPYSPMGYLTGIQNFPPPTVVYKNRQEHGDYFKKPTAFWFFNIEPTNLNTIQFLPEKDLKIVNKCKSALSAGLCSTERSMISPAFARNFICDKILGKKQNIGQLELEL